MLSAREHFEPLQSTVYSHFMDQPCHYADVLALESFRVDFSSCSMAKAINQSQTCQVGSHVSAPSLLVSQSLFCRVLFLSLLRWRQQYFCTSQWEHPLFSQHVLFRVLQILSGQNLRILIHFPAVVNWSSSSRSSRAAGSLAALELQMAHQHAGHPSCLHTMHLLGAKAVLYKTPYTMWHKFLECRSPLEVLVSFSVLSGPV